MRERESRACKVLTIQLEGHSVPLSEGVDKTHLASKCVCVELFGNSLMQMLHN